MSASDDRARVVIQRALEKSDGTLRAAALCQAGRLSVYVAGDESKELAPRGTGKLLELLMEAATRAQSGVLSFRDPDGRSSGRVLVEPVSGDVVLVAIANEERAARIRMRRAALALRDLY